MGSTTWFKEWEEVFDQNSGKPHYYNILTKTMTWEKPDDNVGGSVVGDGNNDDDENRVEKKKKQLDNHTEQPSPAAKKSIPIIVPIDRSSSYGRTYETFGEDIYVEEDIYMEKENKNAQTTHERGTKQKHTLPPSFIPSSITASSLSSPSLLLLTSFNKLKHPTNVQSPSTLSCELTL